MAEQMTEQMAGPLSPPTPGAAPPMPPDPPAGLAVPADVPPGELPRGPQGGVELCHRCRTYRATETVHYPDNLPTCEVCDPSLAPADEPDEPAPAKKATRKRSSKKTATRKGTR